MAFACKDWSVFGYDSQLCPNYLPIRHLHCSTISRVIYKLTHMAGFAATRKLA